MPQRWIITGANGYLGGELCKHIHQQQGDVIGITREGKSPTHLASAGIPCRTYEDLPACLSPGAVFIHCAGKTGSTGMWEDFVHVNRDWTVHLYDQAAAHQADCFIHISSVAAMGYKHRAGGNTLDETSAPEHVRGELYGRSKLLAEQALQDRAKTHATRLVILRPGLIYGRRPEAPPQTWLRRGIIADPGQRIPLVHIDSFIEAVVRAAARTDAQGVFLVVDKEQPAIRDLNALKMQHGILQYAPWATGKAGFWPFILGRIALQILKGHGGRIPKGYALARYCFSTRRLLYSTEKLRTRTGWAPAASLDEGLAECAKQEQASKAGCGQGQDA